ncbi:MAG: YjbQ family protein [Deltaproteobacteria bacterium]|nr:YjbQ family protein [Deltaproteobacteria bacterium]
MGATERCYICFPAFIEVITSKEMDVVDLTADLKEKIKASGVFDGVATLFVAGSTAALTTIEFEPGAVNDLKKALSRLAPEGQKYDHDSRWGDGNGRSHVRAALLGPSLSIPIREGEVVLGTWQQVVLVELDLRSRNRLIYVHVSGTVPSPVSVP